MKILPKDKAQLSAVALRVLRLFQDQRCHFTLPFTDRVSFLLAESNLPENADLRTDCEKLLIELWAHGCFTKKAITKRAAFKVQVTADDFDLLRLLTSEMDVPSKCFALVVATALKGLHP
jgi:hypothetical protein